MKALSAKSLCRISSSALAVWMLSAGPSGFGEEGSVPNTSTRGVGTTESLLRGLSDYPLAHDVVPLDSGGRDNVAGCYTRRTDILSGYSLHLFPDGSAMIDEFSDISRSRLIAVGTWRAGKDRLQLHWSKEAFRNKDERDWFHKQYGRCDNLVGYVVRPRNAAVLFVLVSEEMDYRGSQNYLVRRAEYIDWERIASELRETGQP
jgi:hypothetical protein